MNESILIEIKKLLGLPPEDTSFDLDILININAAFSVISQLGVDMIKSTIDDESTIWSDCFGFDITENDLSTIKMFTYMKVRKGFDPPQSGTAMEALNSMINEYEWRLNVSVDPKKEE